MDETADFAFARYGYSSITNTSRSSDAILPISLNASSYVSNRAPISDPGYLYAKTAREEGFPEIAKLYEDIIQVETCHQKLFAQLYDQMKNGTMYKKKEKVKWKCADCGYEATAKEAWQECPLCKAKQGAVMIQIED